MNNRTTLAPILQSVLPKEEMELLLHQLGYVDTARKFTAYDLFLFLAESALQQWDGYRDGEKRMPICGLPKADHSTISKKAKDVPFEVFKQLLHSIINKCNRPTRRRLRIPKELLLVDSSSITVGRNRLPWTPIKGEKAGIKLHVSLLAGEGKLHKVTESTGLQHDINFCNEVTDPRFILVADRAYGKHHQFDAYLEQEKPQYFVIRLRDNTVFQKPIHRERKRPYKGTIKQDFTCQLGAKATLSRHRFRVVELTDPSGHPVILATNLHRPSAERIAEIYRQRWQVEVFFRWIKQHLNVPKLFGTTPNAVYGQLYTALIVYVLLQFLYVQGNNWVHPCSRLSFAEFDRLISLAAMPPEWKVYLALYVVFP
jgi:hypothetical protein